MFCAGTVTCFQGKGNLETNRGGGVASAGSSERGTIACISACAMLKKTRIEER